MELDWASPRLCKMGRGSWLGLFFIPFWPHILPTPPTPYYADCLELFDSMSVEVALPASQERPHFEILQLGIEDVLFSNLVLLGLDNETCEKKYGCTMSREMFRTPNVKGMEAVLHFLLMRSVPEAKDVRFPRLASP